MSQHGVDSTPSFPEVKTVRTPPRDDVFFRTLAETGLVTAASEAAGYGRTAVYSWRKTDPEWAHRWADARGVFLEGLEKEAIRRATEGFEQPVFYRGVKVGSVTQYSDRLLELLLAANDAARYGRRGDSVGSTTAVQVNVNGDAGQLMQGLAGALAHLDPAKREALMGMLTGPQGTDGGQHDEVSDADE